MIVVEDERKPDIDYSEILNSIVDAIKVDGIQISNDKVTDSNNLLKLTFDLLLTDCGWKYLVACMYDINSNVIDKEISVSSKSTVGEASVTDMNILASALQQIDDIMTV